MPIDAAYIVIVQASVGARYSTITTLLYSQAINFRQTYLTIEVRGDE